MTTGWPSPPPGSSPCFGPGVFARYDAVRNPLDLGPLEARVAPATRVPTCRLRPWSSAPRLSPPSAASTRACGWARTSTWSGGSRAGMAVPLRAGRGGPPPAPDVAGGLLRQRFGYGRSAPDCTVAIRARRPRRRSPWAAGAWLAVAAGFPPPGCGDGLVPAATVRRASRPFRAVTGWPSRLAGLGLVRTGAQLASAITRLWWPVALIAAPRGAAPAPPLLAAALVPGVLDWTRLAAPRFPSTPPVTSPCAFDDLAYGAGVWAGAVETRSAGRAPPAVRAGSLGPPWAASAAEEGRR